MMQTMPLWVLIADIVIYFTKERKRERDSDVIKNHLANFDNMENKVFTC